MEFQKISLMDFNIEKREGEYGPIWILTRHGQNWKHYVLRSDVKMSDPEFMKSTGTNYVKSSPSVHVDIAYGENPLSAFGYKGVYETSDMDEAAGFLMEDLNHDEALKKVENAIEEAVMELKDQLDDVDKCFTELTQQDIREKMTNVDIAYANLKVKFGEISGILDWN